MIKLSGGGSGGGENSSPGSGPSPPAAPVERNESTENNGTKSEGVDQLGSNAEATMSLVLQLDSVGNAEEMENNNPLLTSTEINTPLTVEASLPQSAIPGSKPPNLQNQKTINSSIISIAPAASPTTKPITVPHSMNKNAKEIQKISSQTNTTQVLTSRIIPQKVPCSYLMHPTPVNTSSPVKQPPNSTGSSLSNPPIPVQAPVYSQNVGHPVKVQVTSEVSITKQPPATMSPQFAGQLKLQHLSVQSVVNPPIQTIANTTTSNVQRFQVKSQNVSQNPNQHQNLNQNMNAQNANQQNLNKPKVMSNLSQAPVQRNTVSRIQAGPKSQVHSQNAHISINQVMSNANMQRVQQMNPNIQKAQVSNTQKVQQTFNNQKPLPQGLNNVTQPNHKVHHANQPHQVVHKVQTGATKMTVQRQPQIVNNAQKSVSSVAMQKQIPGQQGQPVSQVQKQQTQTQQQRPIGNLQKSQTLSSVNSNRVQPATTVSKSNSVPNIAKMAQNSNVLTIAKSGVQQSQGNVPTSHLQQQLLHPNLHQQQQQQQQQQQIHQQQIQHQQQIHQQQQLHQQQMHQQQLQQQQSQHQQGQQQVQSQHLHQQQMMMQKQQMPSQVQKSQSISNLQQKGANITPVSNNQKPPGNSNSKVQPQQQQQQMILRMGTPKSQTQNLQGNAKQSQKMANAMKVSNQQTPIQSCHRNANFQMKVVQPQNVICPQNTQKQPGCIKTIPAQKPSQRNNAPKGAIKTSLNTNMNPLKNQNPAPNAPQKTTIKTLMPQQTGGPSMMALKNQPPKIQQQPMQQKQVMTNQFPQQGRQQTGHVKTLMPVIAGEPRGDVDMK